MRHGCPWLARINLWSARVGERSARTCLWVCVRSARTRFEERGAPGSVGRVHGSLGQGALLTGHKAHWAQG